MSRLACVALLWLIACAPERAPAPTAARRDPELIDMLTPWVTGPALNSRLGSTVVE
jgi:hypothetical protein